MPEKIYFEEDYLSFFKELAANNNKEWFDKNRVRYTKNVKEPFEVLVSDLISLLKVEDNLGDLKASDCIFRINKDIRFNKDKTPYKVQMTASISRNGKKDMLNPGLYFELGPEHLAIYTGVYMPEKEHLQSLRNHIKDNLKKFRQIINEASFVKTFGAVQGEKSKILDSSLKASALEEPLLYNKQFYLVYKGEPELIIKKGLSTHILKQYRVAQKFNKFVLEAIS